MKNFKSNFKIKKNRFLAVREEVRRVFIFSVISVFFIEIFLNKIPACNQLFYDLGQIFLKLCYSFTGAFIIYYINIHIPKENRKVKTFRFINNKVLLIVDEIRLLVSTIVGKSLSLEEVENKTEQEYKDACVLINPANKVPSSLESYQPFESWYTYLYYKQKIIKNIIGEIMVLNDLVDPSILQHITFIDDIIDRSFSFERKRYSNPDLEFISLAIHELVEESVKMANSLQKFKQRGYFFEAKEISRLERGSAHTN